MCSSTPEPPDYGPIAQASEEAARLMAELGYAQLNEATRQYEANAPFVQAIAKKQADIADQTAAQGADYFNYMKDTFRPVEQSLASDVMDFSSPAEAERRARLAVSDIERQAGIQQDAYMRAMRQMGVDPTSLKYNKLRQQMGLETAAARAGAATGAREQADQLAYAKKLDIAGLGRGLPGASVAAYGASTNAGNAAATNQQTPGAQLLTGMGAGASTIGSGQNMLINGLGSILDAQTAVYRADSANDGGLGGIGSLIGTAAGNYFSTKKAKTKKKSIDAEKMSKDVEKMPVDEWQYKKGVADEGTHVGPYAEDMKKLGASDGTTVDVVSAIGVNLAATKGVAKRLSKIEKKLEKMA